jgi:hypothetical protein
MYYVITAKRWFQRTYGNTYHSVLIERVSGEGKAYKREKIGYIPFAYGYDQQYLQTAADILNVDFNTLNKDIRNNPEKYVINCIDVNRKKDL